MKAKVTLQSGVTVQVDASEGEILRLAADPDLRVEVQEDVALIRSADAAPAIKTDAAGLVRLP
jgi:hypothetical protein